MRDPLLALGFIMIGMALGALLTTIRYKTVISRIVREEIAKAQRETTAGGKGGRRRQNRSCLKAG